MPPVDPGRNKLIQRVLGDSALYPDELKAWLPRFLADNPNFILARVQLPSVEAPILVGSTAGAAFQNSWVNYGGAHAAAGYFKDPWGVVHLVGLVKNGTAASTIFTLPGNYRPEAIQPFIVLEGTNGAGRVDVNPDGRVSHVAGNTGYIQLNGISFRAYS